MKVSQTFLNMNLIQLAARYGSEMRKTANENKHIAAIEKVLCSSPKYNPHKSAFKFMYGELRGVVNGTRGPVSPSWLLCFG